MLDRLADLREMWRLRVLEECVRDLRLAEEVVGSVHLDIGQEAIPVGAAGLRGVHDVIFTTYRGHGWALACGVPPAAIFGELMGRQSGVNGGRGGSAYFSAPQYGFMGENSIVGAGAPIAAGAALAGRFDGTNRVAITVFGDGAMNQGSVHEAMNFASAMKLPVIFICENNYWSEMTAINAVVRDDRLYRRAMAYGMPGERIDGNDPSVVRERVGDAIAHAREGGGPVLIEAMTARLVGHYIGDMEQYRRSGELEEAASDEPIVRAKASLTEQGVSASELDALEQSARAEMSSAIERARLRPIADPSTAKDHVYV